MSNYSVDHPQVGQNIPGASPHGRHGSLRSYVIGYVLAALLTAAAFGLAAVSPQAMTPASVLAGVCVLAIAQMLVHVIFFMHINTSPQSGTNILAMLMAILIVSLVVVGSIWIMGHLNDHMATMPELMKMER